MVERKTFESANCSVARSMDVIGDWWSILIVREALFRTTQFDDFQRHLGISRGILARRLKHLVAEGVLEKTGNGRPSYHLTQKGAELAIVLLALAQWGDKWLAGPEGPPVSFRDRGTGAAIAPLQPHLADGTPVRLRDVRSRPGPGADEETHTRFGIRRANS